MFYQLSTMKLNFYFLVTIYESPLLSQTCDSSKELELRFVRWNIWPNGSADKRWAKIGAVSNPYIVRK